MGVGQQFVTISAVILGGLTTHLTNALAERSRKRHQLSTRWDDKKLDAYASYVDRVRASIFLAVELYEHRTGLRESSREEDTVLADIAEAGRLRGRAFERIMLLGGDAVIEAAHELNAVTLEVDWQALGKIAGNGQLWRQRNRAAFRAINTFHDAAREDLGVSGSVTGPQHPERDLLLPPPAGRTGPP
ncbi:hypothetical protein AB0A70_22585 [Streptomyces morookaense]|uniref:hypothetical protein n=1 Tax=Streptomyces morookaense TaxID=1970 RepID=UPI0033C06CFB